MEAQNWIYMDGYDEVLTENTRELVFKTSELSCNDPESSVSVVDIVVCLHNSGRNSDDIDQYLLDEARCTQEDREIIMEEIYNNYNNKIV